MLHGLRLTDDQVSAATAHWGSEAGPLVGAPWRQLPTSHNRTGQPPESIVPSLFIGSFFVASFFMLSDFMPSDFMPSDFILSDFMAPLCIAFDFDASIFIESDFAGTFCMASCDIAVLELAAIAS
jgi:hypothetical protein